MNCVNLICYPKKIKANYVLHGRSLCDNCMAEQYQNDLDRARIQTDCSSGSNSLDKFYIKIPAGFKLEVD